MGRTYGRRLGPGEIIARQGERVDTVFRLRRGRVQTRVAAAPPRDVPADAAIRDASRLVAVTDSAGALLGGGGALLERRDSSLVAETDVELDVIPVSSHGLASMMSKRPELGLALGESLARRLCEVGHGLRLVDGFVAGVRKVIDDESYAFHVIVDELFARGGRLRALASRMKHAATYRRGEEKRRERERERTVFRDVASASAGNVRELSQGDWLSREGDSGREMYLVLKGGLEVIARGRKLDDVREGEIVGEIGALLPEMPRRVVAIRAARPSRVLVIPNEKLTELAFERPVIVPHIARVLSRRLARAYRMLAGLGELTGDVLAELDGGPDGGGEGGSVAMDYEMLGRELASWRDELPDVVNKLRTRLAEARTRADEARKVLAAREGEFARGASFREIRGRYEFALAEGALRRVFLRLRGRPVEGESAREQPHRAARATAQDLAEAAEAVMNYAGLRSDYHWASPRPKRLEAHSVAVAAWSELVAERLDLAPRVRHELATSALLHDVGMLRAETTPVEFEMGKHPTEYATALLARIPSLPASVFPPVCEHHEFADGSGYPRRLVGHRLSVGGRILSAANQLDLVIAKGLSLGQAVEHMRGEAGRYDAEVLSALIEIAREVRG
jgi:HD-GYP domain-containing protein (c-di-GMP phosphodiesterase class II)